jgi:hypothetical protein
MPANPSRCALWSQSRSRSDHNRQAADPLPPCKGGSRLLLHCQDQVIEWATAYGANYWRRSDEIVALIEARLVAALKADALEVPRE